MKLIVGLGNIGRKYEGTRHNIGFEVLAELARGAAAPKDKFSGELVEMSIGDTPVLLLAPHTYMNASGRSVRAAVDFYKLPVEDLIVVCDDFHIPWGTLRLRAQGSSGGQKGLANVIQLMGTEQVARLRVGVGPVPDRWDPADFVLGKFSSTEKKAMPEVVQRAAQAARTWVTEGIEASMNQFN